MQAMSNATSLVHRRQLLRAGMTGGLAAALAASALQAHQQDEQHRAFALSDRPIWVYDAQQIHFTVSPRYVVVHVIRRYTPWTLPGSTSPFPHSRTVFPVVRW